VRRAVLGIALAFVVQGAAHAQDGDEPADGSGSDSIAGRKSGVWIPDDDRWVTKFHGYASRCEGYVTSGKWDEAKAVFKTLTYQYERFGQLGLASHPKCASVREKYLDLKARIENRSTTKVATGTGAEVRVTAGKPPTLRDAAGALADGGKLLLSGAFTHVDLGADGSLAPKVKRFELVGSHDPAFGRRDVIELATVFARDPAAKGAAKSMLVGEGLTHLVVDGVVFDGRHHQAYDAAGRLVPGGSMKGPLVSLAFTGVVTFRHCAFQNGAAGLVVLSGKGGEVMFEHCTFIGTAGPALVVSGEGTRVVVRQCTFACVHGGAKGVVGAAIEHRATGSLEVRGSSFSHVGVAVRVTSPGLTKHRMFDNVGTLLSKGFFEDATGPVRRYAPVDALEEQGFDDAAGNRALDTDLGLDPATALGWVGSADSEGLGSAALEAETARATKRLAGATAPPRVTTSLPVRSGGGALAWPVPSDESCSAGARPLRKE